MVSGKSTRDSGRVVRMAPAANSVRRKPHSVNNLPAAAVWLAVGILMGTQPARCQFVDGQESDSCPRGLKWGYIDKNGKIVIPARFSVARDFSDGLAAVGTGAVKDLNEGDMYFGPRIYQGQWGFIDRSGKEVIPQRFASCGSFNEGLAPVCLDPKKGWGFIDRTGNVKIPASFRLADQFSEGLAAVLDQHDQFGYIDKTGAFVIDPQFPLTRENRPFFFEWPHRAFMGTISFHSGLAAMTGPRTKGRYWTDSYIRRDGSYAFSLPKGYFMPSYQDRTFAEGLAVVRAAVGPHGDGGMMAYIDTSGTLKVSGPFVRALSFSEGLAPVLAKSQVAGQPGLWGYIDKTGHFVIKPQYDSALPFAEGVATVTSHKMTGKWVENTEPGCAARSPEVINSWSVIDKNGKTLFGGKANDHVFGTAPFSFHNGLARIMLKPEPRSTPLPDWLPGSAR